MLLYKKHPDSTSVKCVIIITVIIPKEHFYINIIVFFLNICIYNIILISRKNNLNVV